MAKYETLNVNPKCKSTIDRLANKFEMSRVDFVEKMTIYFDKTGINPLDIKVLTVAEELKKFKDTIISFMRKQEKDFILPTFGKMDTLIIRMKDYIDNEAPKQFDSGSNKGKVGQLKFENKQPESKEVISLTSESIKISDKEFEQLKDENEKLELKLSIIKGYLENIIKNTSNRSTGFNRQPVIDLPMGEINSIAQSLKRL